RNHQSLALLMFDVDDFKQFNDRYGHPAGDDCLRRISAAIKSYQRRPGDLAARYGGEEIALLLPGTDLDGARSVAEQVCQGVRGLQIAHSASDSGILSVSCGVDALVPVRNRDLPHDLLEGADKALYAAKSAGRDQLVVAPRRDA
ncbi:MAG: diguanylate cyclase, partial [Burkholderiaceae bacterium]|nr:diguanylate cyclase [Burkholderiaceae bacterium]